jgi:hypothetical protein
MAAFSSGLARLDGQSYISAGYTIIVGNTVLVVPDGCFKVISVLLAGPTGWYTRFLMVTLKTRPFLYVGPPFALDLPPPIR